MKFFFVLTCLLLTANNALSNDTYTLKNSYISPNLDLGYNYALSAAMGVAYSSAFNPSDRTYDINTFYQENNGNYIYQGVTKLPREDSVNSLTIADDYLLVWFDSSVDFYKIEAKGQLSLIKSLDLKNQLVQSTNLNGRITRAGQGRYVFLNSDYMQLVSVNTNSLTVNILDTFNFSEGLGQDNNAAVYLQYKEADQNLWLVNNDRAQYRFDRIDLSSQTFDLLEQHEYNFGLEFDSVNEAGVTYAHHDAKSNAVLVQGSRRTFIFELATSNNTVNLRYNELRGQESFLTGAPNSDEQLIERNGMLYSSYIDWTNFLPVHTTTNIARKFSTYDFISENLILGQNSSEKKSQIFSLQQGIFTDTNVQFSSLLANALPKRLIDSMYDPQSSRILMLGSAAHIETLPQLYTWQYNSQEDTADFISSAPILPPNIDADFYNFKIVGTYQDYIYIYAISNLSLRSEILVFHLVNAELQLVQDMDWSGLSDIVVSDFAFVAPNKIAFFPYIPANNAYYIRLCDLAEEGTIASCADKSILEGRTFNIRSSSFNLTKLQNSEQLLLAPTQIIYKDFEQEVSTWLLQYNPQTEQIDTIQTLVNPSDDVAFFELSSGFTYAQGNKLSLRYESGGLSSVLKWNSTSQQWDTTENEVKTRPINEPMATAESTYYISDDGRPYLLDNKTEYFFRSDQTRNLGNFNSTYKITTGNKGYVINIDEATLTTFELAETTPVFYKGGFNGGSIDAIQDIPFEVDFSSYFLNLKSNSIELFANYNEPIEVLSPSIKWDGEVLSGTLNNEDMFVDESSSQAVSEISIRVEFDNSLLGNYHIVPINVNDPPVLLQQIATQTLEPNEMYQGDLNEIVVDPDREMLVFSYANMPSGMTGSVSGNIQGGIAARGDYAIAITATDPNGATLKFTINIRVANANLPVTPITVSDSSGGGSVGWFTILFLLFSLSLPRNREPRIPASKLKTFLLVGFGVVVTRFPISRECRWLF